MLCRVKKELPCHDLEAYEMPLMHAQQGSILHLPSNTGDLQGISRKSLQHHITGVLLPSLVCEELRGNAAVHGISHRPFVA